jgi:hypothetical protein
MTPEERQQLTRIERKTNAALAGVVLTLLIVLALSYRVFASDLDVARADREQFPVASRGLIYYASTAAYPAELQAEAVAALRFTVAMSSRQTIAERCVPVAVSATCFRLSLAELQWDWREWHRVLASYPYAVSATVSPITKQPLPLIVDAGWLIVQLSDASVSDAHYRLLYADAKIDRNKFLEFWGVNRQARSSFGIITESTAANGPSVAGLRQIDNYPTNERGSAWGTRDSAVIDAKSDPLEHLEGDFKHDAEEWLVAHPKLSSATGARGFLLAAILSDSKGVRVDSADNAVVTDHLGFRQRADIRTYGSCVGCHASGLNPPSNNRVRDLLVSGVAIYAKKPINEKIEAFHLSDSGLQLRRDNEDYSAGVLMVTGLTGPECATSFRVSVDFYDRSVNLGQAARELGCEVLTLQHVLALASNRGYPLPARLAALAHAEAMPRSAWEGSNYRTAQFVLENFR